MTLGKASNELRRLWDIRLGSSALLNYIAGRQQPILAATRDDRGHWIVTPEALEDFAKKWLVKHE